MKDPTIPAPADRKKFMFYDTAKRQIDLKIRCRVDNLNQSMFFRIMMTGYLEHDENIVRFIQDFKKRYQLEGRSYSKKIMKDVEKGTEVKSKFGLDEADIESFFDIMEQEHPEL
tara:strand:- start:4848 stop:5189 length:342 start_codon:yes stop_codon:yes gene_type:complete